jgi:hypothetical protein
MDFGEPVHLDAFRLNARTGTIQALSRGVGRAPVRAVVETSYRRSKGPKVLTRIPVPPDSLRIDIASALRPFERVFAVDSAWRDILGTRVVVGCIVLAEWARIVVPGGELMRFAPVNFIEIWNPEGPPENLCWAIAFQLMQRHPNYHRFRNIGVVVDSNLSDLEAYNTRSKPVYHSVYLPESITLIYASSDSGGENLPNQLMRCADREARVLLQQVIDDMPDKIHREVPPPRCTSVHLWRA